MNDREVPTATDFAGVLNTELDLITTRRQRVRGKAPPPPGPKPDPQAGGAGGAVVDETAPINPAKSAPLPAQKEARLEALQRHLAGLALSGGGDPSATFALRRPPGPGGPEDPQPVRLPLDRLGRGLRGVLVGGLDEEGR